MPPPPPEEPARAPVPWGTLGTLLSFDLTVPFVPSMGLDLPPEVVSRAMRRGQGRLMRDLVGAPGEVLDPGPYLVEAVRRDLGPAAGRTFERWASHTYLEHHSHAPQWSCWARALSAVARAPERADEIDLPPRLRGPLLTGVRAVEDLSDLEPQIEQARERPLSDYDILMMALSGYDPDYRPYDPYQTILRVARHHRFQHYLRQWSPRLDEASREALLRSVEAIVDREGFWLPVPLVDFVSLPVADAC